MVLLPSASRVVCCGLYVLPSKLLTKRSLCTPHAFEYSSCVYVYTSYSTKYLHKCYTICPVLASSRYGACAVPSRELVIYPLVVPLGNIKPRGGRK